MPPETYYKNRLLQLDADLKHVLKKKSLLAWLRFACIAGMIAGWFFLSEYPLFVMLIPVFVFLVVFVRLVFADLKNKSAITHINNLIKVNTDELKALDHDFAHFDDGAGFMPRDHAYAGDLDIFGHASLYQFINRTNAEMGSRELAAWLLAPANRETILKRQEAIKELAGKNDWRQQLQALGLAKKIQAATQTRLQNWFGEQNLFINNKLLKVLRYIVPVFILTILLLNFSEVLSAYTRNYCLLAVTLFAFYISKRVSPLHQQVSKIADELDVLAESIALIEKTSFSAPLLQQLQSHFAGGSGSASKKLRHLKKIVDRLDLRYNFLVFIPIDILFQWDLQQAMTLEKWKKQNHEQVVAWFTALGTFEALNSLSVLAFNHPQWCYPVLEKEHFFIEGKDIGHPLISVHKRVNNPVRIDNTGEIMLVTGSNMAGKSTYLRSIGVNTVLAMAGAPVCASVFRLSPVHIISSMRIADNLEESTSTFYAELKKLKTVIDSVNQNEKVFVLLDEILRGTNSLDRHTGSAALIKQLIKHKAVGIVATHDLELANLKNEFPNGILNFHFDVQVNNEELYFDYKLREGVCTSLNASILMKKIGIEL